MKPENVKCPDCDGPMVSRTGKFGVFWGCKAFPNCRGTRDSMGRSKADREMWKAEQRAKDGVDLVNDDSPSENSIEPVGRSNFWERDTETNIIKFSFKKKK